MTYNIIFYEKENGKSEIWDFLEKLRKKSSHNKDARIQYKQISLYIELLQNNGTTLPNNINKHIEEDIWELRPGNNRIFYFYSDCIFRRPSARCTAIVSRRSGLLSKSGNGKRHVPLCGYQGAFAA